MTVETFRLIVLNKNTRKKLSKAPTIKLYTYSAGYNLGVIAVAVIVDFSHFHSMQSLLLYIGSTTYVQYCDSN